jgi:hypothetical protein
MPAAPGISSLLILRFSIFNISSLSSVQHYMNTIRAEMPNPRFSPVALHLVQVLQMAFKPEEPAAVSGRRFRRKANAYDTRHHPGRRRIGGRGSVVGIPRQVAQTERDLGEIMTLARDNFTAEL